MNGRAAESQFHYMELKEADHKKRINHKIIMCILWLSAFTLQMTNPKNPQESHNSPWYGILGKLIEKNCQRPMRHFIL